MGILNKFLLVIRPSASLLLEVASKARNMGFPNFPDLFSLMSSLLKQV
jgi:hypothetical protein